MGCWSIVCMQNTIWPKTGKTDDYNEIESPFEAEDFAVGVRKDDQGLADKINEGLKTLQENGTFAEISEKWFGEM